MVWGDDIPFTSVTKGSVGSTYEKEVPAGWIDPAIKISLLKENVRPSSNMILMIHLSNFHHARGGIYEPPVLQLARSYQKSYRSATLRSQMLLGILLIVGLYHLVLFLMRRTDRVALFFGLFCLMTSLRTFVMGIAQSIANRTSSQYTVLLRLEISQCR